MIAVAQSPEQIAQNWASGLSNAGQKIADGVNGVTVAPGRAAAAQVETWAANTVNSKAKWARNTAAVPLEDWRQAMVNKGVPRIASGAQAAQGNFATFMGKLLPYIDNVKAGLPARGGLEQNIARSAAFIRGMSKFQK